MLSNEKWFGASAGFYPVTIGQSLRFEDGDSPTLSKTPSSAGNRKTFTISFWFKRGNIGSFQELISAYDNSSANNSTWFGIAVRADDTFTVNGWNNNWRITNRVLRDTTNWYHVVVAVDSTQSTANDRIKIYINGVQETSFSSTVNENQNHDFGWNNTIQHRVGSVNYSTNNYYFDGYLAEVNNIDGTALTPSSFGETKNGVWIPKTISGLTYGTNGFRFTFADSSSLGDDTSGNGNDYTSSGLASTDVVLDSPTNNFATLNNLIRPYEVTPAETVSDGNLNAYFNSSGVSGSYWSTFFLTSGKWYFEVNVIAIGGNADVGISNKPSNAGRGTYTSDARGNGYFYQKDGQKGIDNTFTSYGNTYTTGDIIGCAFDLDNNTITFYKNNSSQGQITGVTTTEDGYIPAIEGFNGTRLIANFGQDSTFNGNETAQGNTDGNGKGNFYYAPPSGFLALCSANLPDTTISPNQDTQADDHFDTQIWSGDSSSTRDITSYGFQPDWSWIKNRTAGNIHILHDSSRGVSSSINTALTSGNTDPEGLGVNHTSTTVYGGVSAFLSNGFTLKEGSTDARYVNKTSNNYVGWNWKAGGTTPTKTYKVVVVSDSGNKFRFRNSSDSATFAQSGVTLNLQELGTYTFDVSDSSMSGHALKFSTTSDGIHGGGSEYTTGVTSSGTSGQTGAYVQITVASSAPTLYYYCGISGHSGMGGQISTNSTFGSTNFDGSILSVSQTNETSGFSIVTYTANNIANSTIGHGLNKVPKWVLIKKRSGSQPWFNWHTGDATEYMYLNSTASGQANLNLRLGDDSSVILPTSTVITLGGHDDTNDPSGATYVAYVFAEIEGYSKFGSYTGNGSTDGTFVYTGFRPAWVMIKQTNSTGSWVMHDNKRSPFNVIDEDLFANLSSAESDNGLDKDFISSGFKLRSSHSAVNGSGSTYIYMAFAKQPFHLSNAR